MTAKVVIVTGNNSGIGRATFYRLRKAGYLVMGTHADSFGTEEHSMRLTDLTDPKKMEHLVGFAAHQGELVGLVNNAGILDLDEFGDLQKDDFDRVMEVNVWAPLRMSELAVSRGCTNIVNISGMVGKTGAYGAKPVYAASKAALNNLTLSLARHLAPAVRVNAVLPGIIPTGIHSEPDKHPEHGHALLQRQGTAEEVANAVAWLLSDESAYVTGTLMEVCGGR